MSDKNQQQNDGKKTAYGRLLDSIREGTFSEILEDWQWIFSYSSRYKGAIIFYTIIGVLSTTLGLVTSVASKYLIDIITGYQTEKLGLMALIVIVSSVTTLVFTNLVKRVSAKLSVGISNDIQADIYDKIMDARWSAIIKYRNGDILNRFNSDVVTVSGNAISWMPSVIIAVYKFIATFLVIWHYDRIMALLSFLSAPVLLLDEATSALDAKTEGRVLENIRKFCPRKACIVTTHHASVLNLCTRLYRAQDKQVTELNKEEASRIIMDM